MKKTPSLILFLFVALIVTIDISAQTNLIDSLDKRINNPSLSDSLKVEFLNEIAYKSYARDVQKTFDYSAKAIKLATEINFQPGIVEATRLQGIYYLIKSDMKKAKDHFKQAYDLSEKINFKEGMASTLSNLGVISIRSGEEEQALNYYKQAILINEELGDKVKAAAVAMNTGVIYFYRGNYPKTLEYYQKSLSLYEEAKDDQGILSILNNIGLIYEKQEDFERSQDYKLRALKIAEKINAEYQKASILQAIGVNYEALSKIDSALIFYNKSLEINAKLEDQKEIATVLINISSLYISQKKFSLSKKLLDRALKINKKLNDPERECYTNIVYGYLFNNTGNYDKAVVHLKSAKKLADQLKLLKYQQMIANYLSLAYGKLGNYKAAYYNQKNFKAYSDSLFNENNIRKITSLENKYEFDKEKQALEEEQRTKDILHQEEVKREQIVRNFILVGTLILLIMVFLIYRGLIQKKKANKILADQKEELKRVNDKLLEMDQFKEAMTGTIVHDLKNPLNSIINPSSNISAEKQILNVKQSGRQMLNLVQNILDVYKYENQEMKIEKSLISPAELIKESISEVEFLAEQKNIKIKSVIETNNGVEADKEIIKRVLVNLLTNAIKYTPLNKLVTIEVRENQNNQECLEFKIVDQGIGIPESEVTNIFDKYTQINAKKSGGVRSTGLGLTFCKMAIDAHKNDIQVYSEEGEGSSFVFSLAKSSEIIEKDLKEEQKNQSNIVELSIKDKKVISKTIVELEKLLVYESTKINLILDQVNSDSSESLKIWVDEMRQCVYNMNEDCYKNLLSQGRE